MEMLRTAGEQGVAFPRGIFYNQNVSLCACYTLRITAKVRGMSCERGDKASAEKRCQLEADVH